jgi:hypothetical protein
MLAFSSGAPTHVVPVNAETTLQALAAAPAAVVAMGAVLDQVYVVAWYTAVPDALPIDVSHLPLPFSTALLPETFYLAAFALPRPAPSPLWISGMRVADLPPCAAAALPWTLKTWQDALARWRDAAAGHSSSTRVQWVAAHLNPIAVRSSEAAAAAAAAAAALDDADDYDDDAVALAEILPTAAAAAAAALPSLLQQQQLLQQPSAATAAQAPAPAPPSLPAARGSGFDSDSDFSGTDTDGDSDSDVEDSDEELDSDALTTSDVSDDDNDDDDGGGDDDDDGVK